MSRRVAVLVAGLLLLIFAVVQVRLATLDSQTSDEAVHLSAGYTYLTRGDYRFNPEHPPLVKILAALPLLVIQPNISPQSEQEWQKSDNFFYDSWRENRAFGNQFLYESGNDPDQILFWARLPIILITLVLGVSIFLITLKHWGSLASLVTTALFVTNPTVNGHGHLVTTDMAIALGFLLTIYSFYRLLEAPNWKRGLWFGAAFGLALLAKHTAVILLPTIVVLMLVWNSSSGNVTDWKRLWCGLGLGLLLSWVLIWSGYGFHDRLLPKVESVSQEITQAKNESGIKLTGQSNPQPVVLESQVIDRTYNISRPILSLLPGDYVKGVAFVLTHVGGGHDSYLLGQTSKTGWWYYFPVLLLLKTPLLALASIIGTVIIYFRSNSKDQLVKVLLIGSAVFFLVAMTSRANLGIRHILPIMPLLFISAGYALTKIKHAIYISVSLIVVLLVTWAITFPTYLGYFNVLAGGSANGYRIATDSNLDWGQDLKRIKSYIDQENIDKVYLEYNWLPESALDHYLGDGSYQMLSEYIRGQNGTAIINAGNWVDPNINRPACYNQKMITNAVFVCDLL